MAIRGAATGRGRRFLWVPSAMTHHGEGRVVFLFGSMDAILSAQAAEAQYCTATLSCESVISCLR